MNLTIDIGNTLAKCAIFREDQILQLLNFENFGPENAETLLEMFPQIDSVILSSVVNHSAEIEKIFSNFSFFILNSKTPIPIINKYKSPETLGNDRLSAAVAANYMFPSQNVLIVDAGTCIKYDFINSNNQYLGGAISPGLNMRFKALKTFTNKLPLIEFQKSAKLTGSTTKESIQSGVQNGIIYEVKGMISMYEQKFKNLKVILTGGDSFFFDKELKNSIFADPYLVLKGLNIILNHNKLKSETN
jgi:type III pantothenate kinase